MRWLDGIMDSIDMSESLIKQLKVPLKEEQIEGVMGKLSGLCRS